MRTRVGKATTRDERRARIAERVARSMAGRCPTRNVKGDLPNVTASDPAEHEGYSAKSASARRAP